MNHNWWRHPFKKSSFFWADWKWNFADRFQLLQHFDERFLSWKNFVFFSENLKTQKILEIFKKKNENFENLKKFEKFQKLTFEGQNEDQNIVYSKTFSRVISLVSSHFDKIVQFQHVMTSSISGLPNRYFQMLEQNRQHLHQDFW